MSTEAVRPVHPVRVTAVRDAQLSRRLWLVKWLLALPHHLALGFLLRGVRVSWAASGLIGLLTLFAGVALAATGHCPRGVLDLVTGLNRWVLRVAAHAALHTDAHPPFRLDQGGTEPEARP
ncbi:DUF4389 domain-containing protein [Streptomyces europaeiscabiei]|uniref:DUF4389 domain-containing protein n=1 Tax=Streptomyces europaeiscabiei TaxID=146819 RepID=UPI003990CCC1